MLLKRLLSLALAGSLAFAALECHAINYFFNKASGVYNSDPNWTSSVGNFVPFGSLDEAAVIGSTNAFANGAANPIVTLSVAQGNGPGGIVLGMETGTTGTFNINGGSVTAISSASHNGQVIIGQGGRGFVSVNNGTLGAVGFNLGGEVIAGMPVSSLSVSGTSNITASTGNITLNGDLHITGPNVTFTGNNFVRFQAGNSYTAEITAADHSTVRTTFAAVLGGELNVEFNGYSPVAGDSWDLVDGLVIEGSFSNAKVGEDVPVLGAPAPQQGSAYRLRQVAGGNGAVLQLALQEVLVLEVNRNTGALAITNPLGGDINIDGYSISSPTAGSLLTSYAGIGTANWDKVGLSANNLNEIFEDGTDDGALPLGSVPSLPLGTGFDKFAVASNVPDIGTNGEDLLFEYTTPFGGVAKGQIKYVGTSFENNLVLVVDPASGQAAIKNDSMVEIDFDGYTVHSSTGALSGGSWSGLGGTWDQSPASASSLTETNPFGPLTLEPGEMMPIGDIGTFSSAAAQEGLSLEFVRNNSANPPGDTNQDGTVNGRDAMALLRSFPNSNYATFESNFGSGLVDELGIRDGAVVFQSLGAIVAVPEPASLALLGMGLCFLAGARRSKARRTSVPTREESNREAGDFTMTRRFASLTIMLAFSILASPAFAVTQGITLVNRGFNDPVTGKTVAFDVDGNPIPGLFPGWTFSGPGVETIFNPTTTDPETMITTFNYIGDSSFEDEGNPGGKLTLSTLDGTVFQTSGFNHPASIPSTQAYRLSFDATDVFTINADNTEQFQDRAQLTASLYYEVSGIRNTIASQDFPLSGGFTNYVLSVPGDSPALSAAVGNPIGVEFDTTSIEFNEGTEFAVAHSWASVDNVLLQIAGVAEGDLDGDGDVDLADYAIIRDAQQTAQIYLADGEITGDDFVDLADFRAWTELARPLPPPANGAVPEPSSLLLGLASLLGISGSRLFRRRALVPVMAGGLVAGIFLSTTSVSQAELLAYDPFLIGTNPAAGEYTVGGLDPMATTGLGQNPTIGPSPSFFTGPWEIAAPGQTGASVQEAGLSFIGAPALGGSATIVGNATTQDGRAGRYLANQWTAATEGTFFIGFIANFGQTTDANMGYRTVEFWNAGGAVGNDGTRTLEIGYSQFGNYNSGGPGQNVPSTAKMAVNLNGNVQIFNNAPDSYNEDGANHLVVIKFELSSTAAMDAVTVYLDPRSPVEPIISNASYTGVNFTLSAMSTVSRFGGGQPNPVFDELRVGTTFADVVPEFPYPGDTDGDGDADINDYNTIAANFSSTGVDASMGDVTGDGKVTLADFRLWKDNRTDASNAVGGAGVPEPCSALLAGLAMLGVSGVARRRSR